MAYCMNCGHQLADGAKYCFDCGAKIDGDQIVDIEIPISVILDRSLTGTTRKEIFFQHICYNMYTSITLFENLWF